MSEATRFPGWEKVRTFCALTASAVLADELGGWLLDSPSGKQLALHPGRWEALEPRLNTQSGRPYLVLRRDDGVELALTEAGLAFAPDYRNSGPQPLPSAVCWGDFHRLHNQLKHLLYGHPEEQSPDAVSLLLGCIAILDGARTLGFDIGAEEREVEAQLAELERRGSSPS